MSISKAAVLDDSYAWTVRGLTKRFGSHTALRDVTLSVPSGVTGLVGANGAGKSTLMKILLGLEKPDSGTVECLGHDMATTSLEARRRFGYAPEGDCLPPGETAFGFLAHLAELAGLPHASARERTGDVLRLVGLGEAGHRLMGSYSTGMKQRAKVGQALVHDPSIVLLDEPTNGLDPAGRDDMLSLIQRVSSDFDTSVLVSSHLLGELERVCDYVIMLTDGQLESAGAMSDLTAKTGWLRVELMDRSGGNPAELVARMLSDRGQPTQLVAGRLLVPTTAAASRAVVAACRTAGVGLVRMEPARRALSDVFVTEG